ncbi:MAG: SCO family protein [Pseudomonadota bacterium]
MFRTNPLPLALIASVCLAACGQERPIPGEITLNEAFVADFDLIDVNGEQATDERFEGKPMLIYYGFTSCPDVCPVALSVLAATLDQLGSDADKLQPLFITVDPERDTPERLGQHLAFAPEILGLTGSVEAIEDAKAKMRVFAKKVPLPNSEAEYTVDHQSMFFLTDAEGTPIRAFDDTTDPETFAQRLKTWL